MNLWYVYVENLIGGKDIENLQKYCRLNYGAFFSMRTMTRSLAVVEKERLKEEKKFAEVLQLWNAKNINL